MEDIVTARFDYATARRGASPVRMRLSSTVVRVRHEGDAGTGERGRGHLRPRRTQRSVRPRQGVRARLLQRDHPAALPRSCRHASATALLFGVKTPLVYTNVLLRNWRAFEKLGVSHVYSPSGVLRADVPRFPGHRSAPIAAVAVARTSRSCCTSCACRASPGCRAATSIAPGAASCCRPLSRPSSGGRAISWRGMLGGGGFDPAKDILRDHRQPMAARLCRLRRPADRSGLAEDDEKPWVIGPPAVRTHRDRELRRGARGRDADGDRRRRTARCRNCSTRSPDVVALQGAIQSVTDTSRPPCISQMKPARWAW